MKNLKYLKLFEAFESSAIRGVLSYIGNKVSNSEKEKFLHHLRNILLESYDFPIDKISDDQVSYMSAKKAFQVQVPDDYDISNPHGVYALKFWFSVEKGYLGFTGVGKSEKVADSGDSFSAREIDYIKDVVGIKTGKLITVTNYSTLKTGDQVVCYFYERESFDKLALGTIIIEDGVVYGIQDVADGGTPSGGINWRHYGRYSWNMGSVDDPADDHSKLHLYLRGTEDLSIESQEIKEFSVNRDGNLTRRRSSYSIVLSDLEYADFAVILYVDDLIGDESVSDVKKLRSEEKKGATALMSDSEIKKLNYQKYLSKIVELYGLTINSTENELRNLQNMVKSISCGDMILFALLTGNPSITEHIDRLTTAIRNLIDAKEDEKSYYLQKLSRRFKDQKENSVGYTNKFNGSIQRVKEYGDEKTNDFIYKIVLLSKKINKYLSDSKIETIEELLFIRHKLQSIRNFVGEQCNEFSDGVGYMINNFYYNDGDVNTGARRSSQQENLDKDNRVLALMERYIDTILR